jgi:hypothetical protein
MAGDKGTYRSVYSAIWDDPEFQAFDPLEKSVFLLLRTCRDCHFSCIFVCYLSMIYDRMPGVDRDRIDEAVQTLIRAGWIVYERPVLWIVKGLRNDPNYVPGNDKQAKGAASHLRTLPKLQVVIDFAKFYGIDAPFDASSVGHRMGIDAGIDGGIGGAPKQGTGTGTGSGTEKDRIACGPAESPDTPAPTEGWPEAIAPVPAKLKALLLHKTDLLDPAYWQRLLAWSDSLAPPLDLFPQLDGYAAWLSAQPKSRQHKNLRQGFRNWCATKARWNENGARREAARLSASGGRR